MTLYPCIDDRRGLSFLMARHLAELHLVKAGRNVFEVIPVLARLEKIGLTLDTVTGIVKVD
jgi:hypothetical protein